MRKALEILFVLAMVSLVVLGTMSLALADPGSQTWQFNTGNYGDTPASDGKTHPCDNLMSSTGPTGPAATVTVPANQRAWWYMDQVAQVDVSFCTNPWEAEVHAFVDSDSETANLTVRSWKVNPSDGEAIELANKTEEITLNTAHNHYPLTLTTTGANQTIPTGWTIGCSVEWSGIKDLKIGYNNNIGDVDDSWCKTPSCDPGYPTPELPTIVLMSIGLVVLGMYVWLKKRKKVESICG